MSNKEPLFFCEAFRFSIDTSDPTEVKEYITGLNGVERFTFDDSNLTERTMVSGDFLGEIKYNTELTSRDRIATAVEASNMVSEVIFA